MVTMATRTPFATLWALCGLLAVGTLAGSGFYLFRDQAPAEEDAPESVTPAEPSAPVRVSVVHPEKGKMPRTTHQPGNVLSFDSARLYAEVSGYLSKQTVDIGDRVKKGQLLIEIDVPELIKQRDRAAAAVKQAEARVTVARARLDTAKADLKAAKAKVVHADAAAKSAHAWEVFRQKQYHRMEELVASRTIDERLRDEAQDNYEAAKETRRSAEAAIKTAEAEEEAANARIAQAKADIEAAKADVIVTESERDKAQVMVDFAKIRSPYDGYITQRSLLKGDFVRAGGTGGVDSIPLLTVERTDKMRVVVQIPDRDVPYCDVGDPAIVEIDALPDEKIQGKVSRIARSEDTQTKLMRVEIDVDNPEGKIRQGMYGWVTIMLDQQSDQLSIPSTCLVGQTHEGKGTVFVVRDGRAARVPIRIGVDNGELVAIRGGLTARDQVIVQAPPGLHDGMAVTVEGDKK
jgi:RND family efflux transporter MFP subunit